MPLENANGGGVYAEPLLEESFRMSLASLKVLEGRVVDVLGRYAAVTAERDRLQERLRQAEAKIAEMAGQLQTYERERAQIRARVESILGRLEALDLG